MNRAPSILIIAGIVLLLIAAILCARSAGIARAAPFPPYPPAAQPTCRYSTVTDAPTGTRVPTATLTPPGWAYWTAAPAATATSTRRPTPTRIIARTAKAIQEHRP